MNKLLVATLLILSFAGLAAASAADMTIFPKESSTRIDSFTSYEVNIENVGPVKDVYDLSTSNPSEVSIAPRQVELEPGQEETVNVWYNPETSREEGTYSFSVTASSQATGDDYSVSGIVNVIREHDVSINVDNSKTGCLGENVEYRVQVTNDGIQKEEFELTSEFGELSRNSLTLEDGETTEVVLTVSSDQEVENRFNIVAASKTSYAQDIQSVQYTAETCYASDVAISPEEQDVAAETEAQYDVTVRNTGTKANNFVLSTNMGELESNELAIDAKSSKTTTLTVSPSELGSQTIEVTAESTVTSSGTATANVYNGMNAEVAVGSKSYAVCENQAQQVPVTVSNTGAAEETFSLESSNGNFSADQVTLEPGNSAEVNLGINGSEYEPGSYSVQVSATATSFGEPVVENSFQLNAENCWDIDLQIVPEVASAGENRSTIYEIRLNNPGTRENTYELTHEGPNWIEIQPETVTVGAGQTENVYMYAGIPFQKQGEVEITATAVGNQVEDSETVTLLIGEDIEDAIRSERGGGITGAFANSISGITEGIDSSTAGRIAVSVLVGLAITAAVLYYEW